MDESFKIPGISWEGISIQQMKYNQNFANQELSRYKSKDKYLARLQNCKITPVLTDPKFNPRDPCENIMLFKMEWNNNNISQPNGHYMLTANKNYRQNIQVALTASKWLPIDLHVEIMGKGPTPIETGKSYNSLSKIQPIESQKVL